MTEVLGALQDLLARGNHFSPHPIVGYMFGGRRDFAFGIYARPDETCKLLKDKWAGERIKCSLYLFHSPDHDSIS